VSTGLKSSLSLIWIFNKVEGSLYGLRHQYALVNNESSLAAVQQFAFINNKTIDIYNKRTLAFSNMPATLDILYRLCSNLYRFRQHFLSIGSVLDTNEQLLRAEYRKLCDTICERWLPDAVFDHLSENIQPMSSERLIRFLFETVTRDDVNDFPTSLAECVRLDLLEKGEYSIEDWRRCFPVYIAH
jgi:hypothetical protein